SSVDQCFFGVSPVNTTGMATLPGENNQFRTIFAGLAMPLLALCLGACGGSGSSGTASDPPAGTSPPPTVTIQAAAAQITLGQSVVLTWNSTNATSVSIAPSISAAGLPLLGSASVTPGSTTTYTITATGTGGTASSAVTVTVSAPSPPPAPTVTLVAAPTTITTGGTATLTWTSSNASTVGIDPSVGTAPLALSGSASITPAATTTYTIIATSPQGTATATATVTAVPPGTPKSPISHIITVILQNHSFDNLFGTYPMANGLDPTAPSYHQIDAGGNTVSPTLLSTLTTADLNHDGVSYTAAYDGGKMDKYALTNGDLAMQYFDNTISGTTKDGKTYSIATLWNYAQQFALADNFFASAMNSEPANMLYMIAATVHDDYTAGSAPYYDHCSAHDMAKDGGTIAQPLTETNVGDQLNANKVSWVWYQANFDTSVNRTCVDYVPQENPFQYFTTTQYAANLKDFVLTDFQTTLSDPALPAVIWITPAPVASMHPGGGDMANGLQWLDNLVQTVQKSPAWSSTALIVLWDESGGWYDHVPPPQLANTVGLGARVPVMVISPYAKSGAISHQQMDFVSILRFIQWNWGLGIFTDPAQSAREQQTGDLCDLLTIPCSSP
ncbi:MAG: phospholipase, partial [Acidobacteriaceae bacterium]|nr:phospholipase [Acidobacteriaceae bacterium]